MADCLAIARQRVSRFAGAEAFDAIASYSFGGGKCSPVEFVR